MKRGTGFLGLGGVAVLYCTLTQLPVASVCLLLTKIYLHFGGGCMLRVLDLQSRNFFNWLQVTHTHMVSVVRVYLHLGVGIRSLRLTHPLTWSCASRPIPNQIKLKMHPSRSVPSLHRQLRECPIFCFVVKISPYFNLL
jgi:hypothetical protein